MTLSRGRFRSPVPSGGCFERNRSIAELRRHLRDMNGRPTTALCALSIAARTIVSPVTVRTVYSGNGLYLYSSEKSRPVRFPGRPNAKRSSVTPTSVPSPTIGRQSTTGEQRYRIRELFRIRTRDDGRLLIRTYRRSFPGRISRLLSPSS